MPRGTLSMSTLSYLRIIDVDRFDDVWPSLERFVETGAPSIAMEAAVDEALRTLRARRDVDPNLARYHEQALVVASTPSTSRLEPGPRRHETAWACLHWFCIVDHRADDTTFELWVDDGGLFPAAKDAVREIDRILIPDTASQHDLGIESDAALWILEPEQVTVLATELVRFERSFVSSPANLERAHACLARFLRFAERSRERPQWRVCLEVSP